MEEQPDGSFPNQARIDYLQPNTEYQVILSKLYDSGDETRQTMNIRTLEEIDTVTVCKKTIFIYWNFNFNIWNNKWSRSTLTTFFNLLKTIKIKRTMLLSFKLEFTYFYL